MPDTAKTDRTENQAGAAPHKASNAFRRAIGYPYKSTDWSFLLIASGRERDRSLEKIAPKDIEIRPSLKEGRVGDKALSLYDITVITETGRAVTRIGVLPVLAIGANRSPVSLDRVFGAGGVSSPYAGDPRIVTTVCDLDDHAVVSSAHISKNGSIPATLQYAEGTVSQVAVNWLDMNQLGHMNATEKNYTLSRLPEAGITVENGVKIETPVCYVSRHGVLAPNGEALALSAVDGDHGLQRCTQVEAQRIAHSLLGDDGGDRDLFDFILRNVFNDEIREKRSDTLVREHGQAFRGKLDPLIKRLD